MENIRLICLFIQADVSYQFGNWYILFLDYYKCLLVRGTSSLSICSVHLFIPIGSMPATSEKLHSYPYAIYPKCFYLSMVSGLSAICPLG